MTSALPFGFRGALSAAARSAAAANARSAQTCRSEIHGKPYKAVEITQRYPSTQKIFRPRCSASCGLNRGIPNGRSEARFHPVSYGPARARNAQRLPARICKSPNTYATLGRLYFGFRGARFCMVSAAGFPGSAWRAFRYSTSACRSKLDMVRPSTFDARSARSYRSGSTRTAITNRVDFPGMDDILSYPGDLVNGELTNYRKGDRLGCVRKASDRLSVGSTKPTLNIATVGAVAMSEHNLSQSDRSAIVAPTGTRTIPSFVLSPALALSTFDEILVTLNMPDQPGLAGAILGNVFALRNQPDFHAETAAAVLMAVGRAIRTWGAELTVDHTCPLCKQME